MKKGIIAVSVLALLSLAGCTENPQSASALLFKSVRGDEVVVWDYHQDFLLDAQQVATVKETPSSGKAIELAARIVDVVTVPGSQPTSFPVALSCSHPNLVVITSNTLAPKYVEQGCSIAPVKAQIARFTATPPNSFEYTRAGQPISCQEYWKAIDSSYAASQPTAKVTGLDKQCGSVN